MLKASTIQYLELIYRINEVNFSDYQRGINALLLSYQYLRSSELLHSE